MRALFGRVFTAEIIYKATLYARLWTPFFNGVTAVVACCHLFSLARVNPFRIHFVRRQLRDNDAIKTP